MIYEALQVSIEAHKDQLRKLEDGVYAAHPIDVGIILALENASDKVIVSGIVHDTSEDTFLTREFILQKFGQTIAITFAPQLCPVKTNLGKSENHGSAITF